MTRLFIRFYIAIVLILVAAWFVQSSVFQGRFDEQNVRVVERAFAGPLRLARERLEYVIPREGYEVALRDIQERFEFPVDIRTLDDLPISLEQQELLRRGAADVRDAPVVLFGEGGVHVAVGLSDGRRVLAFGPLPSFVGPSRWEIYAAFGIVLLLAAIAIAVLLRPVARQLREVEQTATAIAGGDLSARIDPDRVPKGQQLARAFNTMADRTEALLRTQRELLQAVSHELRTPLAKMRFAIDLIETAQDDQERKRRLESLDSATGELDSLVGELLSYVRMENAEPQRDIQPVCVADAVDRSVDKYGPLYPSVHIDDSAVRQEIPDVRADPIDFQRAIGNLISNACRFATKQVRLSVHAEGGQVTIAVEDDGPGIPPSERQRALQPFVRLDNDPDTSELGRGVGLGLALVQRIVSRHGGTVQIDESPLGGCRVCTTWPVASGEEFPTDAPLQSDTQPIQKQG